MIKLTSPTHNVIYINPDHIISINQKRYSLSEIVSINGSTEVSHDAKAIVEMIQKFRQGVDKKGNG